jgi:hypothetical protein
VTGPGRRFDPAELRTTGAAGDAGPSDAELADALGVARELEALAASDAIGPTDGFEDRVMLAIAREPAPRLVIGSASGGRGGRIGAFVASIGSAWGVATSGGRPIAVRAQALALVLLVAVTAGLLTTAGAITVGGLLNRGTAPSPTVLPTPSIIPTPTDSPSPAPSPTPSAPTPTATPTDEAGETAEPGETARPGRTTRPTETAEPTGTDDHDGGGGNSGPGGGGGSSGPSATDDHGGSGPG